MDIIDKHMGLYTDMYQLSMAQTYFLDGRKDDPSVFYYFYRKNPFEGAYVVFAGLHDLLQILEGLRFEEDDLAYLLENGFNKDFLQYLREFRYQANIYSVKEGEIVFPNMPIVEVHGTLIEAQLTETLLLNILNFSSLVATKAARMRLAAGDNVTLTDFGMRRAHGLGAIHASRATIVGGFDSTSNVFSAFMYNLKASGTMAHSFIQSYDEEITAFRQYAAKNPNNCILLVDTYDTLHSGVPNAIRIAQEMEKKGHRLSGIRLDSGDPLHLAAKSRQMLDNAGLNSVKIVISNNVDEYIIRRLRHENAPVDAYGIGTAVLTGQPDGALDGVYKLAMAAGKPRLKVSESLEKVTLPGVKQVHRFSDSGGNFMADAVSLVEEDPATFMEMHHPLKKDTFLKPGEWLSEPLLEIVMEKGKALHKSQHPAESHAYLQERLQKLPGLYKQFENAPVYHVGLSSRLEKMRQDLVHNHILRKTS
ncbi:MAG: nicotinate phosphoribosyltransferase [Desulfopila sp.]|nr:nicotinate phosphoribosyltransferase [Desulfopila sp.]